MDEQKKYESILAAIDQLSEPINQLDRDIREVTDEEMRRAFLKSLGEVLGHLDGEIGYTIRTRLGTTSL